MAKEKMKKKIENHPYSEKSKFPTAKPPEPAGADVGHFVYLKHNLRDLYIVTQLHPEDQTLYVQKFLHAHDHQEQTKLSSKKIKFHQMMSTNHLFITKLTTN